jgi:hypothetical protein
MKKSYLSPEAEIEKFTIKSAILTTSHDTLDPGVDGGGGNEYGEIDDF